MEKKEMISGFEFYLLSTMSIYGYKLKNHFNQSSFLAENKFLQISPKSSADDVYRKKTRQF